MALRHALIVVASIVSLVDSGLALAEQRIRLREYLGQSYGPELLTYPVSFSRTDEIRAGRLWLEGPEGALPGQLLDTKAWPGTPFVKTARLAFSTTLPPLAEKQFVIHAGKTLTRSTDLRVQPTKDAVEISTSRFAMRLFLGARRFADPVPSGAAPSPVVALRLPNGAWAASSRLYGDKRVTAAFGKLLERGPVVTEWQGRWEYEGGDALDVRVQLAAGDSRVLMETSYIGEAPRDGFELVLSGMPGLRLPISAEWGNNRWGKHLFSDGKHTFETVNVDLAAEPKGLITSLVPFADWWNAMTQISWTFNLPTLGDVITFERWDAGAWVRPAAPGTMPSWGGPHNRPKWVDLVHTESNELVIRFSNAPGERKWLLGGPHPALGRELDRIKDYVLDWRADPAVTYPHLYVTREDVAAFRTANRADPSHAERRLREPMRSPLSNHSALQRALREYVMTGRNDAPMRGRMAEFVESVSRSALDRKLDFMRDSTLMTNLFDALAGEDLLRADQMRIFRARLAWLGYQLADPATWSTERGYGSGNLDMHVSYRINLGLVGALLADHPMAKAWIEPALAQTKHWLEIDTGPLGEWPENNHYANVSLGAILPFLIAARNAGVSDLLNSQSLKRVMGVLARQYVPPDPRYSMQRSRVGYGTLAGGRSGLPGIYAKAIMKDDPQLAAEQQWIWIQSGKFEGIGNASMAGFEDLVTDASLPAREPTWGSDSNSTYTLFSNGYGAPDEHYTFLLTSANGAVSGGETGALIALYAYGMPLSLLFGSGVDSPWTHESPLQNRVLAARNWTVRDLPGKGTTQHLLRDQIDVKDSQSSFLPRQDYARYRADIVGTFTAGKDVPTNLPPWPASPTLAKGPVQWTRQMMLLRDDAPAGINYYLLRDTVAGKQPTEWTMWTMSEKLGTAQEAADRKNFLREKPGPSIVGPRELQLSTRYTAVGQYGVDLEYFIASPEASPRHTLRWGFRQKYYNWPPEGIGEYQDLLHLRLPGDGAYYLALFPHKQGIAAPNFASLDEGRIIRVGGEFGTDWGLLSDKETIAEAEGVRLQGTAASVQNRKSGLVLALSAAGQVRYMHYELQSRNAVSLRVLPETLVVDLAANVSGEEVTVSTGYPITLKNPPPGASLRDIDIGSQVFIPAGVTRVILERATSR